MKTSLTNEKEKLQKLADDYMKEALCFLNDGKLKHSEKMAKRAKEIYVSIDDKRPLANACNLLSVIYDELGSESMELDCLLEAWDYAVNVDAFDVLAKIYNNIGSKMKHYGDNERALYYLKCAQESFLESCKNDLSNQEKNMAFMLILNMNLATIYSLQGDLEKVKFYYLAAKDKSEYPGNKDLFFAFQSFEGMMLWRLGEKEKAQEIIEVIMQGAKGNPYATDYMEIMQVFLSLLEEMGDYERWEMALHLMSDRLKDNVGTYIHLKLQQCWVEFYKKTGRMEEYQKACVDYYELFQVQSLEERRKNAENLELKAEMHRVTKEKEHNDFMAFLDPLTKIGNRNKMIEEGRELIEQSVRSHTAITMGLIDVDYFKECNDTYGHIKGDECLQKVTEIIRDVLGEQGKLYRLGGDEFLILMHDVSDEEITGLGTKIKERLTLARIPNSNSAVDDFVTVSQGYAKAYADLGDSIEYLVDLADKVLYFVKRNGRNDFRLMHYKEILELI